ncbi:PPOX class F420-dependent oxidoreductase [Streptomyces sp. NBC_00243]|uniref:PPOX class F420-dependent oxidoreductase n=1 Tax=Streptomyces sp. NBC_00243 TaxID=2975688 RepID=UPI002DD8FA91|nr:PPOX class F420-dependent oxidoreductase [Streptomyces sp. NBC_00243]WRZ25480.1 PPOX class F420-dependent oxidoreductase [Streptomyces sp. NBC_00243]
MTVLDELSRSRYVSLTTYRKNGTGVATPVWHAVDGGELFLSTTPDSWKVKRIRKDARVVVAVCGPRGHIVEGAPSAEGTARILDAAGTDNVRRLLARKYLTVRLTLLLRRVFGLKQRPAVAIAISF